LQYPLIFWEGEDGYYFPIPQTDPTTGMSLDGKKVSAMDFYAYRMMVRHGAVNHIIRCRQLFHQFIVDMYAKIESERLLFTRGKQRTSLVQSHLKSREVT
jgi:hypothetical protein